MHDSNSLAASTHISADAKADLTTGCEKASGRDSSLKQQLLILKRKQRHNANFKTQYRCILGLLAIFIDKERLSKISVIFQPATTLNFHHVLMKRKYAK